MTLRLSAPRLLQLAALALALFLTAELSAASNASKDPFVGTWSRGDGFGLNISITFRADGVYWANSGGCVGPDGRSSGRWTRRGSIIEIAPTYEENQLAGFLRRFEFIGTEQLFRLVATADGSWQRDAAGSFARRPELTR